MFGALTISIEYRNIILRTYVFWKVSCSIRRDGIRNARKLGLCTFQLFVSIAFPTVITCALTSALFLNIFLHSSIVRFSCVLRMYRCNQRASLRRSERCGEHRSRSIIISISRVSSVQLPKCWFRTNASFGRERCDEKQMIGSVIFKLWKTNNFNARGIISRVKRRFCNKMILVCFCIYVVVKYAKNNFVCLCL